MKESPSIDQWPREAKADPTAKNCGMYLTHNGTARQTAKARASWTRCNSSWAGSKANV